MSKPLTILHITDPHIFADNQHQLASINTYKSLKMVLDIITSKKKYIYPDAVILTGDISQDYSEQSYRIVQEELLKSFGDTMPIFSTHGNHDEPKWFEQYFGQSMHVIDQINHFDRWRFIVLNSQLPGKVYGLLDNQNMEFLLQQTINCKKPTALFLHHHLLPVGSEWLDKINLFNSQQLLELLEKSPQIKLVVSGHVHQATESHHQGVTYLTTPSTGWQFAANCQGFELGSSMPGYRWLQFETDGRVRSMVERIAYNADFRPEQILGY